MSVSRYRVWLEGDPEANPASIEADGAASAAHVFCERVRPHVEGVVAVHDLTTHGVRRFRARIRSVTECTELDFPQPPLLSETAKQELEHKGQASGIFTVGSADGSSISKCTLCEAHTAIPAHIPVAWWVPLCSLCLEKVRRAHWHQSRFKGPTPDGWTQAVVANHVLKPDGKPHKVFTGGLTGHGPPGNEFGSLRVWRSGSWWLADKVGATNSPVDPAAWVPYVPVVYPQDQVPPIPPLPGAAGARVRAIRALPPLCHAWLPETASVSGRRLLVKIPSSTTTCRFLLLDPNPRDPQDALILSPESVAGLVLPGTKFTLNYDIWKRGA